MKKINISIFVAGFVLLFMLAPVGQKVEVQAESADFYTTRAMTNAMHGKDDQAIADDFKKALEIDPNNKRTYSFRACYYHMRKLYDFAIADLNKVLEIDPKDASSYNNRGYIKIEKGEYDQAIADFNKALEIDPNDAISYLNRAFAYYKKEDYDKAWEDVHKAEGLGTKLNKLGRNSLKGSLKSLIKELRKASGREK